MRRMSLTALVAIFLTTAMMSAQDKPAPAAAPQSTPTAGTVQDKSPAPATSSKPLIVVNAFVMAKDMAWPYDLKELQKQTVAELTAKTGKEQDVAAEVPAAPHGHVYTLNGEVTSWRPGNRAKRMLVGMGSGRESADIHYWLTDEEGKKIFDNKDTIRAEFWGNAYAGSVGELAHPFADKIAGRIKNAKLK